MSDYPNVSKRTGNAVGHRWRTERATPDHAEKLIALWSILTDASRWDSFFAQGNGTPGERLFFMLSPDHCGGCLAAHLFWREFTDADPRNGDFVQAFAEGALGFSAEGKVHGELLRKVVLAA